MRNERRSRVLAPFLLGTIALGLSGAGSAIRVQVPAPPMHQASAEPSTGCPVTRPNRHRLPRSRGGNHGDGTSLATTLPDDGRVAECTARDGSLARKWPWWRGVRGPLRIEGRRLDSATKPLQARIPKGYGDSGFQSSAVIFPTQGCWEVAGSVGEARLSLVVLVEKIADDRCVERATSPNNDLQRTREPPSGH